MSPSVVLAQDFSEEAKQEITDILGRSQKEFNIPGFVALVTNSEGEIYAEAFGFSDVADKPPMQEDNIFCNRFYDKADYVYGCNDFDRGWKSVVRRPDILSH